MIKEWIIYWSISKRLLVPHHALESECDSMIMINVTLCLYIDHEQDRSGSDRISLPKNDQ